jgi:hypothetical protein
VFFVKGATGATAAQADKFAGAAANLGTKIIAMGYSEDVANQGMLSLTRGIGGAFAALDQFGLTAENLKSTGLWSGMEDDVDGFIAALEAATGDTSKFMNTFTGSVATLSKEFAVFSRNASGGVFDALKGMIQTFNNADPAIKNFVFTLAMLGGGFTAAASAILPLVQLTHGLSALKQMGLSNIPIIGGLADKLGLLSKESKNIDKIGKELEGTNNSLNKLNNLKINVSKNIINVLKGAAIALVAIGAALVVFVAGLLAIAVAGIVYKSIEPQVKAGVEAVMTTLPTLLVLGGIAVLLALIGGLGLETIPAMLAGLVVALAGIGLALLTLIGSLYMLAQFGSAAAPYLPALTITDQVLSQLSTTLQSLIISLALLLAVDFLIIGITIAEWANKILSFFGEDSYTLMSSALQRVQSVSNAIIDNPINPPPDISGGLYGVVNTIKNLNIASYELAAAGFLDLINRILKALGSEPGTSISNALKAVQKVSDAITNNPITVPNDPSGRISQITQIVRNIKSKSEELQNAINDLIIVDSSKLTGVINSINSASDKINGGGGGAHSTPTGRASSLAAAITPITDSLLSVANVRSDRTVRYDLSFNHEVTGTDTLGDLFAAKIREVLGSSANINHTEIFKSYLESREFIQFLHRVI